MEHSLTLFFLLSQAIMSFNHNLNNKSSTRETEEICNNLQKRPVELFKLAALGCESCDRALLWNFKDIFFRIFPIITQQERLIQSHLYSAF